MKLLATAPSLRRTENDHVVHHRIEGRDKVTGRARYTGDLELSDVPTKLLHAAVFQSRCAGGRVIGLETTAAEQSKGVHTVLTHLNAPRLKPVKTLTGSELDFFLPLQNDVLYYDGQPIALVVADTLIEAQHAVSLITARYQPPSSPPSLSFPDNIPHATIAKKVAAGEPGSTKRGHPERALTRSALQLDFTYATASAHHNPIEPGASIAAWDEGRLTAWSSTQFVNGDATSLGQAFGFGPRDTKLRLLPQAAAGLNIGSKIRVIAPLIGGAFGSKATGPGLLLAAMAAKATGSPVKVVLTREQSYALMPYRSALLQRVRIGASSDGRLSAMLHDSVIQNSEVGAFIEPAGELTPHLYACEHLKTSHKVVRLATNAPGWMRAPGAAPGLFSVECAMDELAEAAAIDPVELRLRNYAEVDPATGHEWSSKSLRDCYQLAGDRIGWWKNRDPRPASMQEGGLQIGFGMATAMYLTNQFPSVARVSLRPNGEALVESAAHEIGQGAITALTQVAAESLGLPVEKVHFQFGDTDLPFAFITAGSSTTLSVGSAIQGAAHKLRRSLLLRASTDKASPLYRSRLREIQMCGGRLYLAKNPSIGESVTELLNRHPKRSFSEKAIAGRTFGRSRYGRSAFGAQFVKVLVDPESGQVRVRKMVGAFACGRIINPLTARSQLLGGMVWGIGHALLEETVMDARDGTWINSNLAEALVPTHSDVPSLEALLVEEDDSRGSALGAKGLGEIGITGVAAAIANAIYHATGKRVRELPIKPGKLLSL